MHKFHLGQTVRYRAARGLYAASGAYVVAKLSERDGEYEYASGTWLKRTNGWLGKGI